MVTPHYGPLEVGVDSAGFNFIFSFIFSTFIKVCCGFHASRKFYLLIEIREILEEASEWLV
jgi:hypothetical protein